MVHAFPTSQRDLLIAARGTATQAEFAKRLGVDRSCLSRYEREQLGAPTSVLNYCLKAVAELHLGVENGSNVQLALAHVRRAADALEQAAENEAQPFDTKRIRPASTSLK